MKNFFKEYYEFSNYLSEEDKRQRQLYNAVLDNNLKGVEEMLQQTFLPDYPFGEKEIKLNPNFEYARYHDEPKEYISLLSLACAKGYEDMVKLLVKYGANINKSFGCSDPMRPSVAIVEAAKHGQTNITEFLLKNGANVHVWDDEAILEATKCGHTDTVKVLLENGANPFPHKFNAYRNQNASCVFVVAAIYQKKEMLDFLFENIPLDHEGMDLYLGAALTKTIEYNREKTDPKIVQSLLNHGASCEIMNSYYGSALDMAISNNCSIDIIENLLNHFDANQQTVGYFHMDSPLINASREGRVDVVKLLLDQGADVNAIGYQNTTALTTASRNGHLEIVDLLLKHGANVDAMEDNGNTALINASKNGHTEIGFLLLNNGATLKAKNNNGKTALRCAKINGHKETAKLLKKHAKTLTHADDRKREK